MLELLCDIWRSFIKWFKEFSSCLWILVLSVFSPVLIMKKAKNREIVSPVVYIVFIIASLFFCSKISITDKKNSIQEIVNVLEDYEQVKRNKILPAITMPEYSSSNKQKNNEVIKVYCTPENDNYCRAVLTNNYFIRTVVTERVEKIFNYSYYLGLLMCLCLLFKSFSKEIYYFATYIVASWQLWLSIAFMVLLRLKTSLLGTILNSPPLLWAIILGVAFVFTSLVFWIGLRSEIYRGKKKLIFYFGHCFLYFGLFSSYLFISFVFKKVILSGPLYLLAVYLLA